MISVLFDTEACFAIKENNNIEKSYCRRNLLFCRGKKIRIARLFIFHYRIYILGKNIKQSDVSENDSK